MGAGASAVEAALSKLSTASDAEVRAAVEELPLDQRSRIAEQLKEVDMPGEMGEADNCVKTHTITVRSVAGDALLESLEAPKTTAEILTLLEKSDRRPGPHYRAKLLLKEEMLKATQVVGEGGTGEVTELSVIWEADLYLKKENLIREIVEAEAMLECFREAGDREKVEEMEKRVKEARLAVKRAELELMQDQFKQIVVNVVVEPGVELEKKDLLSTAFNKIDFDETGKISFKNLKWVIKGKAEGFECMGGKVGELTDEELQEIIDEADRDGDGEINQDEFALFFKDVKL